MHYYLPRILFSDNTRTTTKLDTTDIFVLVNSSIENLKNIRRRCYIFNIKWYWKSMRDFAP